MKQVGFVITLFALLAMAVSCATDPRLAERQDQSGLKVRCFDLCASEFTVCSNRNPGDYTACSGGRQDCEKECHSQAAEQRVEPVQETVTPLEVPEEPAEPVTPPLEPTPEAS